jgi:hypothetical protein
MKTGKTLASEDAPKGAVLRRFIRAGGSTAICSSDLFGPGSAGCRSE